MSAGLEKEAGEGKRVDVLQVWFQTFLLGPAVNLQRCTCNGAAHAEANI